MWLAVRWQAVTVGGTGIKEVQMAVYGDWPTGTLDEMLSEVRRRLNVAWCEETSAGGFTIVRPSIGQCAVTALLVQDVAGGRLLRVMNGGVSHYFNEIGGREVDLTRDQFPVWAPQGAVEERSRGYLLLNETTRTRYDLLVDRFSHT